MRLLHDYIYSKISLIDLLGHARQFSTKAHYQEWMRNTGRSDGDTQTAGTDDQFFVEAEALIRRKHLGHKA